MSTRFGMADGRCLTLNQSNQLLLESIARGLRLSPLDSGSVRMSLQQTEAIQIQPQSSPCGIIPYRQN